MPYSLSIADDIVVMYAGRIVEKGTAEEIFKNPKHPYTKALLSAVPSVKKRGAQTADRIMIDGDPPDPVNLPPGCRFASRCPLAAEQCMQTEPELAGDGDGHRAACHFADTD